MQLTEFNHKVSQNFVYATFLGNIFKLLPTTSFELSFERIGGVYCPDESGTHGSVWKFPIFISSQVLQEIIHNTCFECGGIMKNGEATVDHEFLYTDAGKELWKNSKFSRKINVRKCTSCGHSHT